MRVTVLRLTSRQTPRSILVTVLCLAFLSQSSGCTVTCTDACEKLLSCEVGNGLVVLDECEDSCQRQEVMYEMWEDEAQEEAFAEHQRCIVSSSCDELDAGTCYTEEMYIFKD